jgi:hypothetical protein
VGHRKIDIVSLSGFSKDDRLLKAFDDFFEILPEGSVRKRLPSKPGSRFQTLATESKAGFPFLALVGTLSSDRAARLRRLGRRLFRDERLAAFCIGLRRPDVQGRTVFP